MFDELEKIYKEKSIYRNSRIIVLTIVYLNVLLYCISILNDWNGLVVLCISIPFSAFILYSSCIFFLVYRRKINLSNILMLFNVCKCIKLYFKLEKEVDMKLLVNVLNNFKVDNRDKLKVVINHYNSLISEDYFNLKGSFSIIISIFFPLITFFINDKADDFFESNTFYISLLLVILIISYLIVQFIFMIIDKYYGKRKLYRMIEESLNELYANFENYIKKHLYNVLILIDITSISKNEIKIIKNKVLNVNFIDVKYFSKNNYILCTEEKNYTHIFIFKHRNDICDKLQLVTEVNDNIEQESSYSSYVLRKKLSEIKNISFSSKIDRKYVRQMYFYGFSHTKKIIVFNIPKVNYWNINKLYSKINKIIYLLLHF